MELRCQGTQFLQHRHANGFQVWLCFADVVLVLGVASMEALEVAIQPHGIRISREAPLRSTKQHRNVGRIGFYYARRNSSGLNRLIYRRENNVAVARDMDDYAASGKVGDDFILGRLILRGNRRMPAQPHEPENY